MVSFIGVLFDYLTKVLVLLSCVTGVLLFLARWGVGARGWSADEITYDNNNNFHEFSKFQITIKHMGSTMVQ